MENYAPELTISQSQTDLNDLDDKFYKFFS
jgi:hypothetical protein